jgi:hypothetical protein
MPPSRVESILKVAWSPSPFWTNVPTGLIPEIHASPTPSVRSQLTDLSTTWTGWTTRTGPGAGGAGSSPTGGALNSPRRDLRRHWTASYSRVTVATVSLTPQLIDGQPQRDPSDRQGESSNADSEPSHDQTTSLEQFCCPLDPRRLQRGTACCKLCTILPDRPMLHFAVSQPACGPETAVRSLWSPGSVPRP